MIDIDEESAPAVLHFKDYGRPDLGPDIRMCCECSVRLWTPDDGIWTDDHGVWSNPPPGFINCEDAKEK